MAMKKKHDGKRNVVTFAKGDFATLVIASGDRTGVDPKRMNVKIVKVLRDDVYKLQCEWGIIN